MKKNLVFVVVMVVSIGGYIYNNQLSEKMPSLLLENIEALADPEIPTVFCLGTGSVDCPYYHDKVYTYGAPYSLHY